jgi:peroxiredoxin Q/BCP
MDLEIGSEAPSFCARDTYGEEHCLDDYRGKWVVLYFYPKDSTPGCTVEAIDFTARKGEFTDMGAEIIGVSADSEKSHQKFTDKHDLSITLLSDPDHSIMGPYGAWKEKSMYGRTFLGIHRSTVLIDPEGRIAHHWPKVKARGHADQVKERLSELRDGP